MLNEREGQKRERECVERGREECEMRETFRERWRERKREKERGRKRES
jgi:hypothetical protein